MLAGIGVAPAGGGEDVPGVTCDPFAGGPALHTGESARWLADGRLALV